MTELAWRHLGRRPYAEVLELQRSLREDRLRGGPDVLLTVEHEPTLTAGRRARPEHLLVSPVELARRGVSLVSVERGGSWTWHGPGQVVAYPILGLRERGLKVAGFVCALERAMADVTRVVFARAGRSAPAVGRREGHPGTWMEQPTWRKVGAVGVHVRRFVTLHGCAWNLDPDPWGFDWIVPCGLHDESTTSLRRELPDAALPGMDEAAELLASALRRRLA